MDLTEKQQLELLSSISTRSEIPAKFSYFGDGADRWDELYHHWSRTGGVTDSDMSLLSSHMESISRMFVDKPGINIVDLGCGNGLPAIFLLKALGALDIVVTYTAVDASASMLAKAHDNIKQHFPSMRVNKIEIDLENDNLASQLQSKLHNKHPSLMLSLGDSLGYFAFPSTMLQNFLAAMTPDDYLLVGNGLFKESSTHRIVESYDVQLITDSVTAPARALGLYDDETELRHVWNSRLHQVEGWITLAAQKDLTIAGHNIYLGAGDEIMVYRSRKYSEAELLDLLTSAGFRAELFTTTKNRSYAMALVQVAQY